jgi:dihydrofolate reductase
LNCYHRQEVTKMATVVADMTMSLDGFIAFHNDDVGPLFDWYTTGPVETPSASESWTSNTDEKSAEGLRDMLRSVGALICGRRLFEHTNGWGGRHPIGCPVIVVSHSVPEGWPRAGVPFHFVNGVERAVALAKEVTGDGPGRPISGVRPCPWSSTAITWRWAASVGISAATLAIPATPPCNSTSAAATPRSPRSPQT